MNLKNKINNIASAYLRDILNELYSNSSGGSYVTLDTAQTIYGNKLFEGSIRMRNAYILDETGVEGNYVKPLVNNGNFFIRDNQGVNLVELNKPSRTITINSDSSMGFGLSYLGLSQYRTYRLPDKSGTLALMSDLGNFLNKDGSNIASQYYDMNNPNELIMLDTSSGKFTKTSNPFKFEPSKVTIEKELNVQGSTYRYNSNTNTLFLGGPDVPIIPLTSPHIRDAIFAGKNIAPKLVSKDEGYYGYNQHYLLVGNNILPDFTGDTPYRPTHPAHDSHVLLGHSLAKGVNDGTNFTLVGTALMHLNDVKAWDSVSIFGKGNTNGQAPYNNPNRTAVTSSGFNLRNYLGSVTIVGNENWFGDIGSTTILGSNTKLYRYAFNSIVIGSENQNFNVVKYPNEPNLDLFLDNDIIIGNGNYKDPKRYDPTHNLIIGSTNSYGAGGTFNPNLLPLIEGNFLKKWFRVNGTLEATANDDHVGLSENLARIPNLPGILSGTDTTSTNVLDGNDTDMVFATLEVGKTYQLEMHANSWSSGSWGYNFGDSSDSGNTYWSALQVFTNNKNVPQNFTIRVTKGAVGNLFVRVKEVYVDTPIKPAFILRDSDEAISVSAVVTKAGLRNTIYGVDSGRKISTSSRVTLFGNNVGSEIVSLSNITGFGTDVFATSRVLDSVGMGSSVFTNSEGGYLIGIGNNIAPNNTGSWLLGIGNNVFKDSQTASSNVGIGTGSQQGNNGSFTVSIGMGSVAGSYTNVNRGVIIGHGANPLHSSSTDEIVIGAFAKGNGPQTTTIGNHNTTGTYLRGVVYGGSFARYGGNGTNVLLDDGSVKPLSELSGGSTTITNYVTTDTQQVISGAKTFSNKAIFSGNTDETYIGSGVEIRSTNTSKPTLTLNKVGEYAYNIIGGTNSIEFKDSLSTRYVNLLASGFRTPTGTGTRVLLDNGTTKLLSEIVSGDYMGKVGQQSVTTTSSPFSIIGSNSTGFKIDTNGNIVAINGSHNVTITSSGINLNSTQITSNGNVTAPKFTTTDGSSSDWNSAISNRGAMVSNVNINSLTHKSGYYSLEIPNGSGNTGFPLNMYGTLQRIKSNSFITDIISYNGSHGVYIRTYFNSYNTDVSSIPWLRIYTNQDITSNNISQWNQAHSWGNHASVGYALANGTNATGEWANSSRGLAINPTIAGSTKDSSGDTSLANATYGTMGGILQDSTNGPQEGVWSNRLKILHGNSGGFYTELAHNFTSEAGLWHRRMVNGSLESWVRILDSNLWNGATLTNNGGTLSITIAGITKTVAVGSGDSNYTAGANINIFGKTISVSSSPTFSGSVSATAFYETSLRKYKENIKPFKGNALDLINNLDIVTYDRIDGVKNKIGIIADDTPKEFLSETKDSVDLYKTIFIQAKAIQELQDNNKRLEEELHNLHELIMSKLNII